MPPRSKVAKLPQAVRDELERRIVEHGFDRYEELAEWLQQQGYQIAEDRRAAPRCQVAPADLVNRSVRHANGVGHAVSGDRESIIDSTIHLLNGQVFSTLLEAEQNGQDEIFRLARTVCELSKISIVRQAGQVRQHASCHIPKKERWSGRPQLLFSYPTSPDALYRT